MSNLVERLRVPVMLHSNPEQTNVERREAANEIERLRAHFAVIAYDAEPDWTSETFREIARRALESRTCLKPTP